VTRSAVLLGIVLCERNFAHKYQLYTFFFLILVPLISLFFCFLSLPHWDSLGGENFIQYSLLHTRGSFTFILLLALFFIYQFGLLFDIYFTHIVVVVGGAHC